ncbi:MULTISPECIES: FkbM family methyltransferase [Novosphingobium]|uniref:FkbM family methyltransferase n=1 Tax=Novosphingobium TaxID=165696 RepID=UPI001CD47E9B|nr:FkbM family methyltransferase [Novosphingobium percolationis]
MLNVAKKVLHSVGPLHRALSRSRGTRIHSPVAISRPTLRLGSDYGGWVVVPALLNADSVVYGVGVGEDISFDLALIERFGCRVDAFDPTPICGQWIAGQSLPEKFAFHAIGLSPEDGEIPFKKPATDGHVSFSMANGGSSSSGDDIVLCPARRFSTIARDLGHTRVDLLKMDIEGFEYGVIDDMIATGPLPTQWLIEFHHTMYGHKAQETLDAVAKIEAAGYVLFAVSNVGHEYSFVRKNAL